MSPPPIIENLPALPERGPHEPPRPAMTDDNDENEHDDGLSLSSATSATSVASELSDGQSRPRSASLHLPPRPSSGSTPRSRPRSNPRTRTPMRRPSPLLATGGAEGASGVRDVSSNIAEAVPAAISIAVEAPAASIRRGDEATVRNIVNTRRHRSRAGSIPEEEEDEEGAVGDDDVSGDGGANSNATNNDTIEIIESASITPTAGRGNATASTQPPRAGRLLARAAATPTPRTHRPSHPSRPRGSTRPGPSAKQRPSHRKLRRWNNDRFVGTALEGLHVQLASEAQGSNEQYWKEFVMPNYPCDYRSEFAKLSVDDTTQGRGVRERFLKGEVARRHGAGGDRCVGGAEKKKGEEGWMEQCVVNKLRKVGVSWHKLKGTNETHVRDEMGRRLFGALSPRIRSVVSRSCMGDPGAGLSGAASGPTFAGKVVAAFEGYLVSLALASSKKDATNSGGYPPEQPRHVYDVFDDILSCPPHIVMRSKRHKQSSHGSKHEHAVLVPTVHFYFPTGDDAGGGSGGRKGSEHARSSAFHRILLYAVCQFHGLESSSSVLAPRGKQKRAGGECLKVVTVQGGVLLAPSLKMLDYVE